MHLKLRQNGPKMEVSGAIPTLASIPNSFDFRQIWPAFGLKNPLINTGINTRNRNCPNRQQSAGPWSLSSSRFQPTSR